MDLKKMKKKWFLKLSLLGWIILCHRWGGVVLLCIVGYLAESLASALQDASGTPSQLWQPKLSSDIAKCPIGHRIVIPE